MGMTKKQMKVLMSCIFDAIKEAREEENIEEKNKKLDRIIENLQIILED
ncbi:MAG: hypothetical protein IAC13_00825 [Firmicutes bacterium]|uniref:Uncharacterized protein n=1 Tax=Candidatus Scybalomonas excrementavium TaxID=2840943 RepID=A0A9D9HYJ1_9FIRM|nr:hypothetical protein [Candidatus Scybalomonas excrementavium]